MFLNDNHTTLLTVVVGLLRSLLDAVFHPGNVSQIDVFPILATDHQVEHLLGIRELALHTQRIGVGAEIDATTRCVAVLLGNQAGDALDSLSVSLQFIGIAIDLQLTDRRTGDRDRTHATDTCQRIGHLIVQDLIECVRTLVGRHRKDQNRNIIRAELEDDRVLYVIGERGLHHIQFIAHIVGRHVDINAIVKLQGDNGDVLSGLRSDVFEVADTVQHVLQWFGNVHLDVRRAGTRIGGHHHDGVGLNLRKQIDG